MEHIFHLIVLIFSIQTVCFWVCGAIDCASSQVASTITVSQTGNATFKTVAAALDSIPSGNNQWIKISLAPGVYKEKIHISEEKGCIFLEGSDRLTTSITFDAHTNTMDSVTFGVFSDNFLVKGVTFVNSYTGPPVVPAVAYRSFGDKHAFYSCGFIGYQDTLWDDKGRHYYKSCYIEGAADFIWGNGQAVFEQCAINVTGAGFITAQGRPSAEETSGYVFYGCEVSGPGKADLGRAYNAFSRVIYINSIFSNAVSPEGWNIWRQAGHENDITFAEFNCTGDGADISKRVPWEKKLDSTQLGLYTTEAFVDQDGWIAKQPAVV